MKLRHRNPLHDTVHSPVESFQQRETTNLRRIQHEKNLSQEQLAHDAQVDRAYMSRVERAVTYVGLEIIGKLATTLGSIRPSFSGGPPGRIPEDGRSSPLPTPSVS